MNVSEPTATATGFPTRWEEQNERDPTDGKLLFTFDCGGWQTEGWRAEGDATNIAGFQGYLDFDLLSGRATLVREGLKLEVAKNQGSSFFGCAVSSDTKVAVSANGKRLGEVEVAAGAEYAEYSAAASPARLARHGRVVEAGVRQRRRGHRWNRLDPRPRVTA